MNQKLYKIIALISYLLIILMGDMIGLPFFFWLLFTLFDFGNIDQFFALFGVIGLFINFTIWNNAKTLNTLLLDILSFILLLSPIIRRISVVPIEKFNYLLFIIPTTVFILFYFISFYLLLKQYQKNKKDIKKLNENQRYR